MRRLLVIGFAACAFALAPTLSASAMPVATPDALGVNDGAVIQVKGGHGHRGGHGHHYGWGRGHHYGWRHHRCSCFVIQEVASAGGLFHLSDGFSVLLPRVASLLGHGATRAMAWRPRGSRRRTYCRR